MTPKNTPYPLERVLMCGPLILRGQCNEFRVAAFRFGALRIFWESKEVLESWVINKRC